MRKESDFVIESKIAFGNNTCGVWTWVLREGQFAIKINETERNEKA